MSSAYLPNRRKLQGVVQNKRRSNVQQGHFLLGEGRVSYQYFTSTKQKIPGGETGAIVQQVDSLSRPGGRTALQQKMNIFSLSSALAIALPEQLSLLDRPTLRLVPGLGRWKSSLSSIAFGRWPVKATACGDVPRSPPRYNRICFKLRFAKHSHQVLWTSHCELLHNARARGFYTTQ